MGELKTPTSTAPERTRRTRSDAERNRQSILSAARSLYASTGIDVPLETVARSAGVGIATFYRHFPRGKEQLVAEALVEQAVRYLDTAQRALAHPDPWIGFVSLLGEICDMQASHVGLADLLSMALPAGEEVEAIRQQANDACVELIEKAKATGKLREDVAGEDLLLVLMASAAVSRVTRDDAPEALPRFVALLLRAMASEGPAAPLPTAPCAEQMFRAMARLADNRGCAGSAGADRR